MFHSFGLTEWHFCLCQQIPNLQEIVQVETGTTLLTSEIKFEHGKSPSRVLEKRNIGSITCLFSTANVNIFLVLAVVSWPDHRPRPETGEHILMLSLLLLLGSCIHVIM